MNNQKFCPFCGTQTTMEARFCIACGKPFPEVGNFCPSCGVKLPAEAAFCLNCGTPIQNRQAPAPQPTYAAAPQQAAYAPANAPIRPKYAPGEQVRKDGIDYTADSRGVLEGIDEAGRPVVDASSFFAALSAERMAERAAQNSAGFTPQPAPQVYAEPIPDTIPVAQVPVEAAKPIPPASTPLYSEPTPAPVSAPVYAESKPEPAATAFVPKPAVKSGAAAEEPMYGFFPDRALEEDEDEDDGRTKKKSKNKQSKKSKGKKAAPDKKTEEPAADTSKFEETANHDGYYSDRLPFDHDTYDDDTKKTPWVAIALMVIGIAAVAFLFIKVGNMLM